VAWFVWFVSRNGWQDMPPKTPDKNIISAFFDCAMYALDTWLGKEQWYAAVQKKTRQKRWAMSPKNSNGTCKT